MKAVKNDIGPKPSGLSLGDRLGLIGLIEEGTRVRSAKAPIVSDLFSNLWELVAATAKGARIDHYKPEDTGGGFKVFEITAETGESLGRLNMVYLKKPLPCYYLVYVEVTQPFRRRGLGSLILEYFREFLMGKAALGLLDNIIPTDDPTYTIYSKRAWLPVEEVVGESPAGNGGKYMIYIPPRFQGRDIRAAVIKLLHHLKRKRPVIDMRDNEVMVRQTIEEFKDLYAALLTYFRDELKQNNQTSMMRFMFTRYVTKLVAFRRRITELMGFTGGESLEQIVLAPRVLNLPIQSYAPRELAGPSSVVLGRETAAKLPNEFIQDPARAIEALSNYQRPGLKSWLAAKDYGPDHCLTVGDLLDLGFDPTRLKEIVIDGRHHIFERMQARRVPELKEKAALLQTASRVLIQVKAKNAGIKTNPPLAIMENRGSAYVLRPKVAGIHWEEAVEQLRTSPDLKSLNQAMNLDRVVSATVKMAYRAAAERIGQDEEALPNLLACFVSWDMDSNRPKVVADVSGAWVETVWLA